MNEINTFYCSFVSTHCIVCECGEAFESEDALKEHLLTDSVRHQQLVEIKQETDVFDEYRCGTCDEIFDTEQECVEHQETSHRSYVKVEGVKVEKEDIEDFIKDSQEVRLEGYSFVPRDQYINAPIRVRAHPNIAVKKDPPPEQPSQSPKRKRAYQYKNVICEVCGKRYASNAALQYHQRVHTGVRPYSCTYCPKRFTMQLFQQIHMRIHTGERPFECQQCPKAFTNKAALLRHDRVHTGEKPYVCPKCGKAFSQSNSMKLHVHTVHLKMPAPYKSKKRKAAVTSKGTHVPKVAHELVVTEEESQQSLKEEAVGVEECMDTDNGVYYCVEVQTLEDLNMR